MAHKVQKTNGFRAQCCTSSVLSLAGHLNNTIKAGNIGLA